MANPDPEHSRYRVLSGWQRAVVAALTCSIPIIGILYIANIDHVLRISIFREQYLGVFLGLSLALVFLLLPGSPKASRTSVPWYDWLFALGIMAAGFYLAFQWPALIVGKVPVRLPEHVWLGAIAVVLVLEATRRVTGWPLVIIGAAFILYARYTDLFPGILYDRGTSWERLLTYLYLDVGGLVGLPLRVAATTVLGFLVFGEALALGGGSKVLTDLAMATVGRFRGGPAKMAVVASSLFGTMSGSAVANVMVTGMVTIPMMKRAGYRPTTAGAVEAVASTGGQLLPPVMGATAFLIAEFLGIPYREIALAALVPALLMYTLLFLSVDLEAGKEGLKGIPKEAVPPLRDVLKRSWLIFVPLGVLVYGLFWRNFLPEKAALIASLCVLGLTAFRPEGFVKPRELLEVLEKTGRGVLELATTTSVASLVVGVTLLTGMGAVLSLQFLKAAGGVLFPTLLLLAVINIILGMGMPTATVYILLAVTFAPALTALGVPALSAHLFVFYFGAMSMITPPVALAAYAAASIAGASPIRTGLAAVKLGAICFIVPFLFVYEPALLLQAPAGDVVVHVATAFMGAALLGVALIGYLVRPLGMAGRLLFGVAAFLLLIPHSVFPSGGALVTIIGIALAAALVLREWSWRRRHGVSGIGSGGGPGAVAVS